MGHSIRYIFSSLLKSGSLTTSLSRDNLVCICQVRKVNNLKNRTMDIELKPVYYVMVGHIVSACFNNTVFLILVSKLCYCRISEVNVIYSSRIIVAVVVSCAVLVDVSTHLFDRLTRLCVSVIVMLVCCTVFSHISLTVLNCVHSTSNQCSQLMSDTLDKIR